jgi:integrase-like protein
VRNRWYGQVLFGGSGSKCNGGLNVLGFQTREIDKNISGGISARQAREYGAQNDTRALEYRLPAANSSVADDALFVAFQIADLIIPLRAAFVPYCVGESGLVDLDLPMSNELEARLRTHPQRHDHKNELLFVNRRGRPFSANKLREKQLHPLLDAVGIPRGGFHSMRHGAASSFLDDGSTPAVVQKQLRHSDAHGSPSSFMVTLSETRNVTRFKIVQ